ncbi:MULTISPECIES: ATP-binding cassette domain-containing protein [unclassified Streptomyces]|uniref:ABC transporter ATP-binding protein n=1 Tax=unclassified Streptomyces TaxID=2593676 RepID=UPI00278BD871|nr:MULTISPECIES: ATP-binding cassette domain-containing protein [unclassified Streptomyces]
MHVTLRGAGRRYGLGGPWVLRGVDLDVPEGAVLRVRGPNGTGKSTLLRLVAGIDAPSEGRVIGRPRTAYVPERFPPALPFTARAYLTHMGRIHGLGRATAARRAAHWLERFGAGPSAHAPLAELSKGSSQKVAVAAALLAEPDLLVLDEAWTGLDTAARDTLDTAVSERAASGAAVLFVDHDPHRLTAATDIAYEVVGAAVEPVGGAEARVPTAAPDTPVDRATVLIDASGPAGAEPPLESPDTAVTRLDPRTVRITADAARSDAVLRALLGADPAWHIVAVRPLEPTDPTGPTERRA